MKASIFLGFFLTALAFGATENSLTISVTSPERPLDWTTPGTFIKSLLRSSLFSGEIPFGNSLIHLRCDGKEEFIESRPEKFHVISPLVFQGKGLGYLFATHKGEFTNSSTDLNSSRKLSFLISQAHCDRIKNFLREFQEKKIADRWGLPHRPLMGEGANSTSLAVSMIKVAGLMSEVEYHDWERILYVPKALSGDPVTDQFVLVFSLLGGDWGNHKDQSVPLRFWDPVLIYEWIGESGKTFDRTSSIVPEGNFWEQAKDSTYFRK